MKTLPISLVLLLIAASAAAAAWGPLELADVRDRVEEAPEPAPGEEGLVLFEGRYYSHEDGLTTLHYQRLQRVNSEWALKHVSDPRLRYDSLRQLLTVHATRTYLPGGEFVDSPVNAFNEVTPGALALAVDFLDIKELVVTHTGLVPGAVLWLDYTLRDTAPSELPAGELIFPHGDFPVLEMEVLAEGLYGELVNPVGGLHTLAIGDQDEKGLLWQFRDLPPAPGEATQRLGDQLPHLRISPLSGWEEVLNSVSESMEAATIDTLGLTAWLDEFEADRPFLSDREAVETWLHGIGGSTALLRIESWHWRRAPRSVSRILATSVATPLERAALLIAALRTRAMPKTLSFVRRWQEHGGQLLSLSEFDDPFVWAGRFHDGEGRWLADLIRSELGYSPSGRHSTTYTAGDGGGDPTRSVYRAGGPHSFQAQLSHYWKLESGALRIDGQLVLPIGLTENIEAPEGYLRHWIESDSSKVEGLRLHFLAKHWLLFDADAIHPLPAADELGLRKIQLPMPPVSFDAMLPEGMIQSHSSCRALLFPDYGAQYHLTWILDLPEDVDPVEAETLGASHSGASFTATRSLEGRRLTIHYDLEWDGAPVHPSDYPAFRAFVNAALDPAATRVILRSREEG